MSNLVGINDDELATLLGASRHGRFSRPNATNDSDHRNGHGQQQKIRGE